MGGATATPEKAQGKTGAGASGTDGGALLIALNAASRQGPQSAVPDTRISASAVPPNDTVQAQSPNSDPPLPSEETQTEPLSIGGTRRISWSKANIRTRRLGTFIGQ